MLVVEANHLNQSEHALERDHDADLLADLAHDRVGDPLEEVDLAARQASSNPPLAASAA